jgi:hypothetical protein
MLELAVFALRDMDPLEEDENGDTPDSCFYYRREESCTVIRGPRGEEERAWTVLMKSVCRQNGYVYRPLAEVGMRCVKQANIEEVLTPEEEDLNFVAHDSEADDSTDDDDGEVFEDASETFSSYSNSM